MAQCAYCQAETEMYDGGDVPICIECSDALIGFPLAILPRNILTKHIRSLGL